MAIYICNMVKLEDLYDTIKKLGITKKWWDKHRFGKKTEMKVAPFSIGYNVLYINRHCNSVYATEYYKRVLFDEIQGGGITFEQIREDLDLLLVESLVYNIIGLCGYTITIHSKTEIPISYTYNGKKYVKSVWKK